MGTVIRPEISTKNKYWISKNRYYELKYFCLQYSEWKTAYAGLNDTSIYSPSAIGRSTNISNPTEKLVMAKRYYSEKVEMIERIAKETDFELHTYILKAVTEGVSYTNLKTMYNIPCSRDTYYDRYRRFFWLLSKSK